MHLLMDCVYITTPAWEKQDYRWSEAWKMSGHICWICKLCRAKRLPSDLTLEEVLGWAQSLESLMATKYGPEVYTAYLKLEHSDENIKFWMACETYKKIASRRGRISRAKKLYSIYIQPQSPREINIDSSTRDAIIKSIQEPTQTCFEEAQKIVYMHMEMDSYPRFLKSEMYQNLLKTVQSQSSWLLPKNLNWKGHIASVNLNLEKKNVQNENESRNETETKP